MNATKRQSTKTFSLYGMLPACALATLLTACATTPPEDPQLMAARSAVDQLEADPLAQQTAGKPLQDARDALAAAESAARERKPQAEIDHLAYLAKRRADIGQAVVDENRARQQMAQAQSQRDAVLLAARERETQVAREQAASAIAQAEISQQQARSAQADAQASAAQAQAAQEELNSLQAKQTERGMVLTLGSNLLFDTGSDVLKPGADDSLNRVAQFLQQHHSIEVRIEGHTDSQGSDSYNDGLSERRAGAVAHALESRGVDSGRVQAVGRGKALPIATNETAAGRQQNRRVEIIFSDLSGQFVSAR
ncbi:MAG TPA: OmpA family protein [Steroidobacteraceae bacterium]|nr:OmpA family protein [Steroidobacteraceae bacterium]